MPTHRSAVALLAGLAGLASAAPAQAKVYDVPARAGATLARVAAHTPVPVRVPGALDLDFSRTLYASGYGHRRESGIELSGAKRCAADACLLASLSGERGGAPAFRRTVALARGITGYFEPLGCGGSCSPPALQWLQSGVLYTIRASVLGGRREMVRAANSAILAPPR